MKFFQIHAENPQDRLIKQAVEVIRKGGVIIYPTDSSYALGCRLGDKSALDRIRRIRRLDDKHNFTLMCRDLSELGVFAKVNTTAFRLLKAYTPGLTLIFSTQLEKYHACLCTPSVAPLVCACPGTPLPKLCLPNWASP